MIESAGIAFRIDRHGAMPVFAQVYEAIRARIVSGALEEGARLPPSRSLAIDLGLSRSTVNAAYEQLVAEGYILGRRGAGYFVRPMGEVEFAPPPAPRPRSPPVNAGAETPPPFQPGVPDMRLFPYAQWARQVARTARTVPAALIASTDPFGDLELRAAIAEHIAEWRGVVADPRRIIVTAGSGDALEICIRTLARPGDHIGLEDPGYGQLRNFVSSLGLTPNWLDIDDAGAVLPAGRGRTPGLVVLTPSHQFPLGGAMSPARRSAFLAWAAGAEAWIVEDDYDSEFRYSGRPIPAMTGLDGGQRTIYAGSFSKVFSNSLRIGYLVVPERLTDCAAQTLQSFGVKASIAPQRPLAGFMADGEFYRHLRRVRRIYNDRRRVLVEALRRDLPAARFADHQAGMLIALRLPAHVDDRVIAREAAEAGLGPLALSAFYARPTKARGLVLGFCAFTDAEIERATPALAAVVDRHLGI